MKKPWWKLGYTCDDDACPYCGKGGYHITVGELLFWGFVFSVLIFV